MKIPKLKKIESVKKHHGISLEDAYAWVDQPNILEVLKDPSKLLPDVKKYIEENNSITKDYFKDVKNLQKKLFNEIKSKIKLDDTSLKFKDKKYFYWVKTETRGNYGKNIRQIIDGSKPEEVYFDGEPPPSIFRAAANMRRGISSARASTPPDIVRPLPPFTLL